MFDWWFESIELRVDLAWHYLDCEKIIQKKYKAKLTQKQKIIIIKPKNNAVIKLGQII